MKTIQQMPAIWDDKPFTTSRNSLLGELARWAVQQSPYIVPGCLEPALREFDAALETEEFFESNCEELRTTIRQLFEQCPRILAWNNPRKGDHTIAFCSRHDRPTPDYDFVDLDALARNIAHSLTLEAKYDQLHNQQKQPANDKAER